MNKTMPKDKSDTMYFEDKGDLISTKPLLLFYQMTPDKVSFKRAQYIHSQKMWIDWEGFQVYKEEVVGWLDVDRLSTYRDTRCYVKEIDQFYNDTGYCDNTNQFGIRKDYKKGNGWDWKNPSQMIKDWMKWKIKNT